MSGMVGREYVWKGRRWRVVCRWFYEAPPPLGCGRATWVKKDGSGRVAYGLAPPPTVWHESPWVRVQGVVRNVLIEDVLTGERIVRPFRGLRKTPVA